MSLVSRIRELPLRYRLSIPFFFLALLGTFSLVVIAILSQDELLGHEEHERLLGYDRAMDHNLELEGRWAVSLASSFARNPEVAAALAARDRMRLINLCYPAYLFMKKNYGISQFNFHVLPPANFVRMQRLYEFGDKLDYRQTILDAITERKEIFGLEKGITGYGIRGVAPVLYSGNLVGTVEIGFSFDLEFLEQIKRQFGIEASLLFPGPNGFTFNTVATTFPEPFERTDPLYAEVYRTGQPRFFIREILGSPYAVLVRSVADYRGNTVALSEFCARRTAMLSIMSNYRQLMLWIGIVGMVFSVGAIFFLSHYFTRPIRNMIAFARQIAGGGKVRQLEVRPSGELRLLAEALDDMNRSIVESRAKIEDYASNLEDKVRERTTALLESEEKYRTLVESVPLVVYRLLENGRVIFINHFIEDLLGVTLSEVIMRPDFWKQKVFEDDRARVWPLMDRCLGEGVEFKAEYRVRHVNGNTVHVLDHSVPILNEKGKVETVDGILVNVTDRYRLQQQIMQTEELKTLSEVSARLAHEIRNPLAAAGGFARRLMQNLPPQDQNLKKVEIIVQEVARLEKILQTTLAYLRPFDLCLEEVSLNDLVVQSMSDQEGEANGGRMSLSGDVPALWLDRELFRKALDSILKTLLGYCRPDGEVGLRTYSAENAVHLEISATGVRVSVDDVEHFFYPFTSHTDPSQSLDLSMAKMIIHKHRGVINLRREEPGSLSLDISLPARR